MKKKVTVLYNVTTGLVHGTNEDLQTAELLEDAKIISRTLKDLNYNSDIFELKEDNTKEIFNLKTDVFFNLCYGIGTTPDSEHKVAELLEKTGKPYTGSSPKAILLTADKAETKRLLLKNEIPTPKFQTVNSEKFDIDPKLKFPLITKPVREDSSSGIKQNAVVTDFISLQKNVRFLLDAYKEPVLIEEYIDGRELRISLLGNASQTRVLPITEIKFINSFNDGSKWKIVDFEAKWDEKSTSYRDTPTGVAKLNDKLKKKIESYALQAYNLSFCRDYADIDVRLSYDNTPYFIEINCNPGLAPTDGTERLAKSAGMTYQEYIEKIVLCALARCRPAPRGKF